MCAGLFKLPFEKFNANAIAHTHSTNALVVSQWAGQRELITWSNNQIIKVSYLFKKNESCFHQFILF